MPRLTTTPEHRDAAYTYRGTVRVTMTCEQTGKEVLDKTYAVDYYSGRAEENGDTLARKAMKCAMNGGTEQRKERK